MQLLLEPFSYQYMANAILLSTLIAGVCGLLSCFLMLKGWSLIGDALSHAIVPGVVGAYILGIPFALGSFFSGGLAAAAMLFLHQSTRLKQDAIIGLIFTSFFALGLFMVSITPVSVDVQNIMLGNILSVSQVDMWQMLGISIVTLLLIFFLWRDWMLTFFDENQARSAGLPVVGLKVIFFATLAACTMASLQSAGAFMVICLVIAPGATAYLLSDRFSVVLILALSIGVASGFLASYFSYFTNLNTGALTVLFQVSCFLMAFLIAPKYGWLRSA